MMGESNEPEKEIHRFEHRASKEDMYYEEESVCGSETCRKRKTCDIRTWKNHLFLDVSPTNIDTIASSLYQCVEARSLLTVV
jgi:hypothetical protein